MYEYKIVRIARLKQEKTREIASKKNKVDTQVYTEIETLSDFYARAEKSLNDFARDSWQIINVNYLLPVQSSVQRVFTDYVGSSATDFDSAEFVVVMQRPK